METIADIFDALKGPAAVGRALSVGASTASEMKRRASIPAEYWAQLVEHAQSVGRHDITYETLALVHAKAKGRLPTTLAEAN